MAQHKSALKRIRSSARRQKRNATQESALKTMIKKVRAEKDKTKAEAALKKAVSMLDTLAQKRVIHPNKAANQKSKLTRVVNAIK
ncbi:MAG TPA: 30S ribosomal protein S20 [Bacteroidota bacterium]|nr:30S ribosomal protein S20 [Bacteroidota bacterium]